MAITKIKSQYLSFTQPHIGYVVNVKIDSAMDWIHVGGQAFIDKGGLYNVVSKTGQIYGLELVIPLKLPEAVISKGFIAPVLYSSDGIPQTEQTLYLMNEYEFLELDDEDTQADFNQAIDEVLESHDEKISGLETDVITDKVIIPLSAIDKDLEENDCQPITFSFPFEMLDVEITVGTEPVGASILVGIKKNGTDISPTTRAKIASGEKTSVGETPIVLTASQFAAGDTFQGYIHQVGSTTAGKDLNIILTIKRL